ncbi:MAG: NUDIX domain-containing protein [Candidatus Thorarchaeota archaeon]
MVRNEIMVVVTAIIENQNEDILLIKRSPESEDLPNAWEDCGGRLKQAEIPEEGLRREIKEELGLDDIEIIKPLTIFHDFRNGRKNPLNELIGIAYWCKTQSIDIILSEEHTEYQWVKPGQAIDIVSHPAVKQYIQIQMEEKQLAKEIDLLAYEKERLKFDQGR